jgi:hypothetical protein
LQGKALAPIAVLAGNSTIATVLAARRMWRACGTSATSPGHCSRLSGQVVWDEKSVAGSRLDVDDLPMEFSEVIRRRRMIRHYSNRPLDPDVVERVLASALRAPSAGYTQGWAFLALTDPADRARFWPFCPTRVERTPAMQNGAAGRRGAGAQAGLPRP